MDLLREKRPMIGNKIKVSGRTIQFYRNVNREAAEKLGYRAGETKDVPSMKLTILIVCTLLLWPSGRALCQANRENSPECALAERALAAYQEIKPGTARKEIEKNFDYDRGIHFRERGRYTYRGCNYIKLEVDFSPAPDIGNTPDPSNDKVMAVSKLFIDYPVKD